MDRNLKIAIGAMTAVIVAHGIKIRKLTKHQRLHCQIIDNLQNYADAQFQTAVDEEFKNIVDRYDD